MADRLSGREIVEKWLAWMRKRWKANRPDHDVTVLDVEAYVMEEEKDKLAQMIDEG